MASSKSSTPSATPLTVAIDGNGPVGQAFTALSQAKTVLTPVLLSAILSAADRKREVRVKHAGEAEIGPWLQLAAQKPDLVAPLKIDAVALLQELKLVEEVKVLVGGLRGLSRLTEDTVLVKLAELWTTVLDIYAIAARTRGDEQVDAMVAKMQSMLANGPRKQKAVKAPLASPIPTGVKALKAVAISHAPVAGSQATKASPGETPAEPSASGTPKPPSGANGAGGSTSGQP